ncbi:MAG: DUF4349 domain-containing protein [Defluviitaleaceae bacterium]|nr:DUF4349 domain-containing protein [Defluviitaleaceae bacterium]
MKLRNFGILMILACLMLVIAACSSADDFYMYETDYFERILGSFNPARAVDMAMEPAFVPTPPPVRVRNDFAGAAADTQVEWEDVAGQNERHIIQTATIDMATEEFDDVVPKLRQLAELAGGYVESESLTTGRQRVFRIVMRVPAGQFEEVLSVTENLAEVRTSNQRAEDVTARFYDLAGNYQTRRIEEERILALISEAEYIRDILALETRLSETRLAIETYLSQLNNMAGQIAFSTISVTLFDVAEEEIIIIAPTLGERVGGAFGESVDSTVTAVQNFIVLLAGVSVPLILYVVLNIFVYIVVRLILKKVDHKPVPSPSK